MRKKNNNMRRGGGHGGHGGGQRRYHNNGGGGGNRGGNNDGQNIQRQKHHATQMREKYTNMARDAQNNGDRVDVEYYLQHVDHYNRVLTDIAAIEAERFAHQREQHQPQAEGGDAATGGDAGGDAAASAEQGGDAGGEEPISRNNQPRMTRGPRHHQQQRPQQQPAATQEAGEAQAEGDIPLPGGVLGAI